MSELAKAIGESIGAILQSQPAARVHGGSINDCYRWETNVGPIFVKVADEDSQAMFAAEASGLEDLRKACAVRVPRVLGVGERAGSKWLALEWIQPGIPSTASQTTLGEQLSAQHRVTAAAFGWHRENTIGSTPQLNEWSDDWVSFFRERRLRRQLELAHGNGFGGRLQERGEKLLGTLEGFFHRSQPLPSLLHGDLWGGNWAVDERGRPVIFDPAVYFGDRETDLAMTRLFGGFGTDFYAAYDASWPLEDGAENRVALYNLYHILNHLNLFGAGYLAQALGTIESLLGELGH